MNYWDHSLLQANKFNCNPEDVLALNRIIDSSKHYHVHNTHRIFSHNTWFIQVLVDLIGDVIPNTKTGGVLSTRDILHEHLREDHNGFCPTIQDWMRNIKIEATPIDSRWLNNPRRSDKELLKKIENDNRGIR